MDYRARWKEIEIKLSKGCTLKARLGDEKLVKYQIQQNNQWINLLNYITKNNLVKDIKILRWAAHDS